MDALLTVATSALLCLFSGLWPPYPTVSSPESHARQGLGEARAGGPQSSRGSASPGSPMAGVLMSELACLPGQEIYNRRENPSLCVR